MVVVRQESTEIESIVVRKPLELLQKGTHHIFIRLLSTMLSFLNQSAAVNRIRLNVSRFASSASKKAVQGKDSRPIILLDVDFVINMLGCPDPAKLWADAVRYPKYITASTGDFEVCYSKTMVERINAWSEVAYIRWLTTLDTYARTDLAPALGLGSFKVAREVGVSKQEAAVLNAIEAGPDRLLIWIDDDLIYWKKLHEDDRALESSETFRRQDAGIFNRPNTVLLSPCYGLTSEHCAFVDRVIADPAITKGRTVCEFEAIGRVFC